MNNNFNLYYINKIKINYIFLFEKKYETDEKEM